MYFRMSIVLNVKRVWYYASFQREFDQDKQAIGNVCVFYPFKTNISSRRFDFQY